MHTGELARRIGADVLARGGLLGPDDLAAYRPVVRPSLTTRVGDWTLATTPPPSVGGVVLAAMLRLLDGRPHGHWSDADVEHLVRVQRAVLGHRLDVLDAHRRPRAGRGGVPRAGRRRPPPGARVRLHRARLGDRRRRRGLLGDGLVGLRRGDDRRGHRDLAQQLPRRAGAQPARSARRCRPAPGCCPTWRRPSAGTPTGRCWRSAPPAPTGSPPRSCRRWPASSAGSAWPRRSTTRGCTCTAPGRPDEVVRRESELSMYFGGVGAALTRPDGHLVAAADPRRDARGAPGASSATVNHGSISWASGPIASA